MKLFHFSYISSMLIQYVGGYILVDSWQVTLKLICVNNDDMRWFVLMMMDFGFKSLILVMLKSHFFTGTLKSRWHCAWWIVLEQMLEPPGYCQFIWRLYKEGIYRHLSNLYNGMEEKNPLNALYLGHLMGESHISTNTE